MNQTQRDRIVARMVHVEDATIVMGVAPKEGIGKLKKEIRHRLDDQKENDTSGRIAYVDSDYCIKTVEREDSLEVIITEIDLKISMNKHIPDNNVSKVVRKTLEAPKSITCVGYFDIREHYLMEI